MAKRVGGAAKRTPEKDAAIRRFLDAVLEHYGRGLDALVHELAPIPITTVQNWYATRKRVTAPQTLHMVQLLRAAKAFSPEFEARLDASQPVRPREAVRALDAATRKAQPGRGKAAPDSQERNA